MTDGDPLAFGDFAIPDGFVKYEFGPAAWRYDVADHQHRALSLIAHTHDLSGLAELPPHGLWKLSCTDRKTGDDALDHLVRFDALVELDLSHTRVSDAGTAAMHTMQGLLWLSLSSCGITDAAMEHLAALRKLEHLDISHTRVTDEGLRALAFHPALRVLSIRDSAVTGEALAPLLTVPQLREVWMSHRQLRHANRFAQERPEVRLLG